MGLLQYKKGVVRKFTGQTVLGNFRIQRRLLAIFDFMFLQNKYEHLLFTLQARIFVKSKIVIKFTFSQPILDPGN